MPVAVEKVKKETCWTVIKAVMPHTPRMLLFGPPGTGKTTIAHEILGKGEDRRIFSITMTEDTPAAEFRGFYALKDGRTEWLDGVGIRHWKEPRSVLIINEINMTGPDLIGFLHGLLDDPERAQITLPTGETVRPSEDLRVIATMNGAPEDLLPAIRDRFPVTLKVDTVNPDAVRLLPKDLQQLAANSVVTPDEERRVSIRAYFEFARLREKVAPALAAKAIFGARAQELLDAIAVTRAGKASGA